MVAGSFPLGLSLSTAGVLSCPTTPAATFTFTVQAADSSTPSRTAQKPFTLAVAPAPTPLSIATTSPLLASAEGSAYSQTLTATGGTPGYTWSVVAGSLPAGLSLSTAGVLS